MSNNMVMAFSPRNIVLRLFALKKRLTKGGHGHPRTPLATPLPRGGYSGRLSRTRGIKS